MHLQLGWCTFQASNSAINQVRNVFRSLFGKSSNSTSRIFSFANSNNILRTVSFRCLFLSKYLREPKMSESLITCKLALSSVNYHRQKTRIWISMTLSRLQLAEEYLFNYWSWNPVKTIKKRLFRYKNKIVCCSRWKFTSCYTNVK